MLKPRPAHVMWNPILIGSHWLWLWSFRTYSSMPCHTVWVNYNVSLTWIVRPFWDDSPNPNHDNYSVKICEGK
jgi:hypothetical protein